MRSKGGPQYPRKETITAFSGSQPGPLFFCRIGEFISLRIVLWTTGTTITWVQLYQNTTSTSNTLEFFLFTNFVTDTHIRIQKILQVEGRFHALFWLVFLTKPSVHGFLRSLEKIGTYICSNMCLTCEYVSNFWGLKYCKSRDTRSKPKTRQYILKRTERTVWRWVERQL